MAYLRNIFRNTLEKSGRFFGLNMGYLTTGGFWTTVSFLVGIGGSLATMVAFGNLLPREAYGIYTYLISLGGSLTFLTLSGIGPAVMRAAARGTENIVPEALRMQLRYNLFAIATVGGGALYYAYKGNYLFGLSLVFLAIAYPVGEAFHVYVQVLTGKKRFDLLAKITAITTFIGTIATVITLILTDSVLAIIAVFATVTLVPKIMAYRWVISSLERSSPDPEAISEMRRTAFHITGAGFIGTIASYIDKIILFQVAGPAVLAVYGFAIAGPERLKSLIKGWLGIALPRLAENSLIGIRSVFYKRISLSVLVGAMLVAAYILIAPYLFKWLLPKYLDSVLYSQAYALGLIVAPATIYIGSIFAGQNMLRAIYVQNIGSHIARIALFVIFGWLWKIWGLVFASIASHAVSAVYSIIIWELESRRLIKKNE